MTQGFDAWLDDGFRAADADRSKVEEFKKQARRHPVETASRVTESIPLLMGQLHDRAVDLYGVDIANLEGLEVPTSLDLNDEIVLLMMANTYLTLREQRRKVVEYGADTSLSSQQRATKICEVGVEALQTLEAVLLNSLHEIQVHASSFGSKEAAQVAKEAEAQALAGRLATRISLTRNKRLKRALDDVRGRERNEALKGFDIVDGVARLCAMNLYLHGIGGEKSPMEAQDSLRSLGGERYDMVLTNPPFGKKSSFTVLGADGRAERETQTYERDDFWVTTSNKQLNFLQHIKSILKIDGRAAVVLPDNVLFEGGAGETVRRKLLSEYDTHTLLRLPTGIFYAQGVKANILFFDRKPASEEPWTKELWIYDLRTNVHFTLKQKTLSTSDLEDFVSCYNPENRRERSESKRFKRFTYEGLMRRDKASLDIFWLKDKCLEGAVDLQPPEVIAAEIAENLEAALEQFAEIHEELRVSSAE